ncbi:helix-turn-helix domain-containing protein [Neobacillus sp. DY30]|uniref:response regulator transcription factor n=1 Tax=Neobacillus sp. DY30 TaxID=3047871 RepID=UPI0024BFA06A|nr:helix-turn-helix domain-containing protein [Neobacillus sp. DY30]WHY01959.1 helix-turn-helix domain-containing protein [Neobacillus sp. DY30]
MNVLLLDDEPLELEQLEYMLLSEFPRWKLYKAANASQANSINQNHEINLAFLDINLPGKSGLEFGEELRQSNKDVEIIMVTACQDFSYAQQSIRIGVVDYLTKPVIERELLTILSKYKENHSPRNYSSLIQCSLKVIHERFAEKISLSDIANEVHANPTYLSRKFHEEVGAAFSEYLIQYRIHAAKRILISHQNWTISEVAVNTGFNSQNYFSTLFRKIEGISPTEFREKEKNNKLY